MMSYAEALKQARSALMDRHDGLDPAAGDAIESLDLLAARVEHDALISDALKLEGPRAVERGGRANRGICVEYMGVRVIIAARAETSRDRGIWLMLSANRPRDVEVELTDWDPDSVVVPVSDLDVIALDAEPSGGA